MRGGFNNYTPALTTPQRLPLLKKAVKKLDADIIGLIDTFRWDEIYTEAEVADLFGYKYCYCINLNDERLKQLGHNNGITLLSNLEITPRTIRLSTRDAIVARVQGPSSVFNLVIVYLDDLSEGIRLEQVRALQPLFNSPEPLLLMGDLNSIRESGRRHAKIGVEKCIQENPEIGKVLKPVIDDMLRSEVINQLESWGLQDADYKRQHPTMPTLLFPAKVGEPFLRIDYCLHSLALSVNEFNVSYDEIFQKASDHFPISFTVT